MKTKLFVAALLSCVLLINSASAIPMGNLVVTAKPEKSSLETSEIPVIVGTVTDQASRPIVNATVNINTSLGVQKLLTDSEGKFKYQYPNSVSPNQYLVSIKAQKDGYGPGLAKTTFFVKGIPVSQPTFKTVTGDKINKDTTASKILKNIELAQKKQEAQQKKIKEIEAQKKFLDEQRSLANFDLQKDLQGLLTQFDPFTPRNAYAAFVNQVNATFQNVFWGQFNFTEQKHNDGLAAKYQILQNGGNSEEARKAYIQKATTKRSEIIQVNNDLNLKYGFADKDTQSKFDKYGKLPRNQK